MNKYLVQYSMNGEWIPFIIVSTCIYEVEEWFKDNIQKKGVCISYIDNCGPVQEEETFGYWSEKRTIERALKRARMTA